MGKNKFLYMFIYKYINWTETQYNRCNEAPTKFSTVPAKYFAKVAPGPTISGSAFAKPWMGRGGGGPLKAQAYA